jgi:hypothetical protein
MSTRDDPLPTFEDGSTWRCTGCHQVQTIATIWDDDDEDFTDTGMPSYYDPTNRVILCDNCAPTTPDDHC